MLVKEYRIPLPMAVEEYRVAQLYMIQKKSRDETHGEGSGVEILENRPYTDGPGGSGQYTHKVYHVGMHIPSWFRSILPKAALRVVEESWNAYPYTRTRFTCPFVEKFSIDIETFYKTDAGENPNVFSLSPVEKNQLTIVFAGGCTAGVGQSLTCSIGTPPGPRGPRGGTDAASLCPRAPPGAGLRKVMVRAHRQAWCWQDEWYGLSMENIRELEKEAQLMLSRKMAQFSKDDEEAAELAESEAGQAQPPGEAPQPSGGGEPLAGRGLKKQWSTSSKSSRSSKRGASPSRHSISEWRMQSIARDSDESSDDEFFDAHEDLSDSEEPFPKDITKWNSDDLMDKIESPEPEDTQDGLYRQSAPAFRVDPLNIIEDEVSPPLAGPPSKIHVLLLVLHGGTILDTGAGDPSSKQGDANTIASVFDTVMRAHYPSALGHLAIRLVPCPPICSDAFALVSNLSPYSHDEGCLSSSQDHAPLAALPLLATSSPQYQEAIATVIQRANLTRSSVWDQKVAGGRGPGRVAPLPTVSVLVSVHPCPSLPSLCLSSVPCPLGPGQAGSGTPGPILTASFAQMPRSSATGGVSLAWHSLHPDSPSPADALQTHSTVFQEHMGPSSPGAATTARGFRRASEISIASQVSGMAESYTASSIAQKAPTPLSYTPSVRRLSLLALPPPSPTSPGSRPQARQAKPSLERAPRLPDLDIREVAAKWWGQKRMDYALYCPDALTAFPTVALPHLFHASYWESTDVVSFLLRQVMRHDNSSILELDGNEVSVFTPSKPREKWQRKRTHVKLRNVTANHRINDAVANEDGPQVLTGRFMYGPLDMVTLTGEKVDVHIMTQPPSGEWLYLDTLVTNSSGRVSYTIPETRRLGVGVYPVKMVVRGDHTFADSYITVLPKGTEFVVFSIDGSFAASVSIMGSDPKVRAGAVDVVRHWQDLGYLIIYVTGRPDMQKQRVVAWLAQHNFPHGVVSFCDGLVHDPLRHKANFLKLLISELHLRVHAAYGSTKDVAVYSSISLSPMQIYIVGRPTKKLQQQCQFITDGYAAHLAQLKFNHRARPARNTATRMALRKGSFGLPGQGDFLRSRNHLLRTISAQPSGPGLRHERTHGQPDSEQRGQRSMSMAAGCWGRTMAGRLEPGAPAGPK
ncbi:membrane-associated phosphatidylinositol transfer protein 2 [Pteropus vampyrus]|uniref:Membrane-associated phosphatidylinositol transfer protein 2 n=1 Tax=Pteropus vampyrus TaxID=132908 RepID=A0A6P6C950_PTEVA|nr:membrane-associated phosphatidylinositol transfer protein 2 [Pteropus vampyrus]